MCGEQYYVSALVGLWIEAVIWGIYVFLFAGCVYVLARRQNRPKFLFPISIALFLICSTLVIVDFIVILLTPEMTANSLYVGGARHSCTMETASYLSKAILYDLITVVEDLLFAVKLLLADGLLIYRCFVLWKDTRWGRWIVVLPILLLFTSSATTYAEIYYDLELWRIRRGSPLSESIPPPNWFIINEMSSNFGTAVYVLSLATTVLTTVLIASRIWWFTRELEKGLGRRAGSRYRRAIALVIESGAIYSLSLIIDRIVSFTSPIYVGITRPVREQIMGIAPTLIIVRLGLGQGFESTFGQPTASRTSQVLSPTSRRITFARGGADIESHHNSHLIQREKPSRNEMIDQRLSIEDLNISDRMPGSPPEGSRLDGFNM